VVNDPSLQDDMEAMILTHPVISIGLLDGWRAGELLEQADAGTPNHQLLRAVFKLLSYRFTMLQFGQMTAFTLDYLSGASVSALNNNLAPARPSDLPALIDHGLAGDPEMLTAKTTLISFEDVITGEFYALTQNNTKGLRKTRGELLNQYFNFISGFHSGSSLAADDHLRETLNIAFGVGYTNGYRDGYVAGYAAGYTDGYAKGNTDAWKAANKIIADLNAQITSLQQQLADAKAAQNSGGGFFSTLTKIDDIAKAAVGIIQIFAS